MDHRIRILANKTRVGYVANFERAIRIASGDVVYFADQDDIWLPEKVAVIDHALTLKQCAASDAIVVDDSLRPIHPSFFRWRRAKSFTVLPIFLRPRIVGATVACRRAYLNSLRPFPVNIPHDFWLTINAAWDGALHVVHRPLILYRRHSQAASVTATSQRRSPYTIIRERAALAHALARRRQPFRGNRA
jgi:glycosyltransferase involved in cell wall biosynthesis